MSAWLRMAALDSSLYTAWGWSKVAGLFTGCLYIGAPSLTNPIVQCQYYVDNTEAGYKMTA